MFESMNYLSQFFFNNTFLKVMVCFLNECMFLRNVFIQKKKSNHLIFHSIFHIKFSKKKSSRHSYCNWNWKWKVERMGNSKTKLQIEMQLRSGRVYNCEQTEETMPEEQSIESVLGGQFIKQNVGNGWNKWKYKYRNINSLREANDDQWCACVLVSYDLHRFGNNWRNTWIVRSIFCTWGWHIENRVSCSCQEVVAVMVNSHSKKKEWKKNYNKLKKLNAFCGHLQTFFFSVHFSLANRNFDRIIVSIIRKGNEKKL